MNFARDARAFRLAHGLQVVGQVAQFARALGYTASNSSQLRRSRLSECLRSVISTKVTTAASNWP